MVYNYLIHRPTHGEVITDNTWNAIQVNDASLLHS